MKRSELATVRKVALGAPIDDLALAGTSIAVATTGKDPDGAADRRIRVGTLGKGLTTVASSLPTKQNVVAFGGQLGVVAGATVADHGVYPLTVGSSQLGPATLLFGPVAPTTLSGSIGQLNVGHVRAGGDPVVRTVTTSSDGTRLTVGAPRVLEGQAVSSNCHRKGVYEVCEVSGDDYDHHNVTVRQDGRLVRQVSVPADGYLSTDLIERGLIVRWTCEDYGGNNWESPCDPADRVKAYLVDLETGARTTLPDLAASWGTGWGDAVWHVGSGGEIYRRDLATGLDTLVRAAGIPAGNVGVDPRPVSVEVNGDWIRWLFAKDEGWADRTGWAEAVAMNVATGQRVDITELSNRSGKTWPHFAAGAMVWLDMDDHDVHVLDLTTGDDRVVGRATARNVQAYAVTSEWVAWMVEDGSVHLLPLGQIKAGTPRYDGTVDAPSFSAAAGADPYEPVGDTNRPVNSWSMTIKSGSTPVRTLTGTAKTGTVRPRWDGKDVKGRKVPDGTYTWTLTGTGPGGSLQDQRGTTSRITGSVRVDSRTPTPTLSAPTTGKPTGFTVKWSSGEKRVRYTVKVAMGTRDRNGILRWGTARTWMREVTATSKTYRNGATTPTDLVKGRDYRFTVTAVDRAGNKASTSRVVKVR